MNTKTAGIIVVLLVIAGGAWWYTSQPEMYQFEFAEGEKITSWDFQGVYTDNAELEERVQTEITRLKGLFGQEGYTDYELYVSIANQYELLGDGEKTYNYLRMALAVDAEHTGLAWHNMGKLLERFGLFESARIAFDAMVEAQSAIQYQTVRLEFLKTHMPEDTEAIERAQAQLDGTLGEFVTE